MKRLQIAQVAHAVNAAYCASLGEKTVPWDEAGESQQASILAGVDMHTRNPDATPEQSHESWLAQKVAEGWTYGPQKDPIQKQHPFIRPYAELPAEQKAKDYLFRGVVHALLAIPEPAPVVVAPVAQVSAASIAAAAATKLATANAVKVRYTGKSEWADRLYGSGLSFIPQQVRAIPGTLAVRFLKHSDVFERVLEEAKAEEPSASTGQQEPADQAQQPNPEPEQPVDDTAELLAKGEAKKAEADKAENAVSDMIDTVNSMDKDALQSFAMEKFGQKVPKNLSVENMRARVGEFVRAYGV